MTVEIRSRPVQTRREVIERLRALEPEIRAFHATGLYLFGSAARDELGPDSDVDLFVDYDVNGAFSFVELLDLPQFLGDRLGRKVELCTRAGLHPKLKERIERSAIKVL